PAGRQRVHARRPGQAAVLRDDRGRGVLGYHETRVDARVGGQERGQVPRAAYVEQPVDTALGDRTHLGGGDGEEVGREAERRAVEVAGRLDAPVREHHGIVHNGHQLPRRDALRELQGVPGGAGDLGRAPHGVRVLYRVGQVVAVTVHNGRSLEQPVDVGRG